MNNEDVQSLNIGHAIDLQFYENAVSGDVIGVLNEGDDAFFSSMASTLNALPPDASTDQIDAALAALVILNSRSFQDVEQEINSKLLSLTQHEIEFQTQLFDGALPPDSAKMQPPNAAEVYGLILATPLMGVKIGEAIAGLEATRMEAVRAAVRAGFVAKESVSDIVRDVRGSRAAAFTDGAFNTSRIKLDALVRTAIGAAAETARELVTNAAPTELVQSVMWLSVLDGRTSPPCRARSRKLYTAEEHKPINHALPWGAGPGRFHWRCRSTSTPIFKGSPVPSTPSYADWLKKQPAKVQDEILGPNRGKLFRDGGEGFDQFVNNRGKWLTLPELRARDAEKFARLEIPLTYWR